MFSGFTEDTYRFFWELAFDNSKSFFEANRDRYKQVVYTPLRELASELSPTVQKIDDRLNLRPASVVSRIRRDTRYSKDQSLYRDHAWLGYKMPGAFVSESFSLYAEVGREGYGYGMGMYAPNAEMMTQIRNRILARPEKFLSMVTKPGFASRFTLQGELYKRPKCPDASEALFPYVNRKNLSFSFYSKDLSKTMTPALKAEIQQAFETLKPVYRFLMGVD